MAGAQLQGKLMAVIYCDLVGTGPGCRDEIVAHHGFARDVWLRDRTFNEAHQFPANAHVLQGPEGPGLTPEQQDGFFATAERIKSASVALGLNTLPREVRCGFKAALRRFPTKTKAVAVEAAKERSAVAKARLS